MVYFFVRAVWYMILMYMILNFKGFNVSGCKSQNLDNPILTEWCFLQNKEKPSYIDVNI